MGWIRGSEGRFWRSVAVRWMSILLAGWLMILWFQGCLLPSTREEIQQQQQESLDHAVVPAPR